MEIISKFIEIWPHQDIYEWSEAYNLIKDITKKQQLVKLRKDIIASILKEHGGIIPETSSVTDLSNVDITINIQNANSKNSQKIANDTIENIKNINSTIYELFKNYINITFHEDSFEIKIMVNQINSVNDKLSANEKLIVEIAKKMLNMNFFIGSFEIKDEKDLSSLSNITQRYFALKYLLDSSYNPILKQDQIFIVKEDDCESENTNVLSARSSSSYTFVCRTSSITSPRCSSSRSSVNSFKEEKCIEALSNDDYDIIRKIILSMQKATITNDQKISLISLLKTLEQEAYLTQGSYLRWVSLNGLQKISKYKHLLIDSLLEQLCFALKLLDKDNYDKKSVAKYLSRALNTFSSSNVEHEFLMNTDIRIRNYPNIHKFISYLNDKNKNFVDTNKNLDIIFNNVVEFELKTEIKNIISTIFNTPIIGDYPKESLLNFYRFIYEKFNSNINGGSPKSYIKYKNKNYLVRTGPKNGKYILYKKKILYLKTIF